MYERDRPTDGRTDGRRMTANARQKSSDFASIYLLASNLLQWRIQDFSKGAIPSPIPRLPSLPFPPLLLPSRSLPSLPFPSPPSP